MEHVCSPGSCSHTHHGASLAAFGQSGAFAAKEIPALADATVGHTWYKLRVSKQVEEKMTERVGHSLVFSPESKSVVMIGGGNRSGDIKQLWMFPSLLSNPFHGSVHEKLSMEFPGLYEFACVYNNGKNNNDEERETVWIFGGANSLENKNDVHALDLKDATLTMCFNGKKCGSASDIPVPRTQGNNSCFINVHGENYLVIFGGGQRGETALPDVDLYLFSIKEKTWKKVKIIGVKPSPVQGHAMASIGTKVFLHGGMDQFIFSGALYVIDLHFEEPIWLKVEPSGPCPSPRAAHGMIAHKNCLYVCSGVGDEGARTDVWKFDTDNLVWQCLQSEEPNQLSAIPIPSPRTDFAMTLVKLGARTSEADENNMLLIHGGMNTFGTLFKDFWVFPLDN